MADVDLNESDEVTIADAAGTNKLKVNSDGSVNVNSSESALTLTNKVYQTSFEVNVPTTAEAVMCLIRNPNGSGKSLQLLDIIIGLTNTVGSEEIYRIYRNPTVTSVGSSQTISSAHVGGGASASSMRVYSSPSVSANGTKMAAGMAVGGTGGGQTQLFEYDGTLILAANNDLLLTGQPDGTNRNSFVTIRWMEI